MSIDLLLFLNLIIENITLIICFVEAWIFFQDMCAHRIKF